LLEKETSEFIAPQPWFLHQILIRWISECEEYCKKVYKPRIIDLDEMKEQLRTEWSKPDHDDVIVAAIRHWRR